MGNSASSGGKPESENVDRWDGVETLGYRVLGVQPNSPASQAGLVSFLDFVVGADGRPLFDNGENLQEGEEYNDVDFPSLLMEFKGRELELVVWNIKSQQQRWVTITPSDSWGGAGLLGVTIRLDDYAGAEERLIHVLDVEHHSPAQIAGLVEYQDYLLGTTTETLDSTETLSKILQSHIDRVVELYVYNCESDMVRVVALMPTWSWGGKGLLGAQVATGYLHRLPSSTQETCGSSLERKVRWVGLAGGTAALPQQSSTSGTSGSSTVIIPTLEMEPQLEMEPADEPSEEPPKSQQPKAKTVDYHNGNTSASSNGAPPVVSERPHYATPPPYAFMHEEKGALGAAGLTTKALLSADTVAAAAAVAGNGTKAVSPSTAPLPPPPPPPPEFASVLPPPPPPPEFASAPASATPAEELFMGPPPVTPPNRRTAKRIQEPVRDPAIQVFVPPPLLSSPYWSQVARKEVQHQPLSTNRSRAFSSD